MENRTMWIWHQQYMESWVRHKKIRFFGDVDLERKHVTSYRSMPSSEYGGVNAFRVTGLEVRMDHFDKSRFDDVMKSKFVLTVNDIPYPDWIPTLRLMDGPFVPPGEGLVEIQPGDRFEATLQLVDGYSSTPPYPLVTVYLYGTPVSPLPVGPAVDVFGGEEQA